MGVAHLLSTPKRPRERGWVGGEGSKILSFDFDTKHKNGKGNLMRIIIKCMQFLNLYLFIYFYIKEKTKKLMKFKCSLFVCFNISLPFSFPMISFNFFKIQI